MTDPYSNLADAWDDDQVAAAQVVSNIDAKPDRALRAIQLAESTGVPATAIYPDLDEFERKQKTIAAAGMVQQNPHLASYMAKDPMNARLSLDDLDALDLTSEAVGRLGSKSAMGTFSERFFEGMQQAGQDTLSSLERVGAAAVAGYDWAGQQHEFDKLLQEPWAQSFFGVNNPAHPGKLAFAAVFGFDSFMRAFNAGMVATAETAGIVGEALTNDPAKGHQLVRDIYQTLQVAAAGPGAFGMTHPHVMSSAGVGPGISIKPFIDPLRAAAPWLREGKEPPLGVHPEIDKLIIEQSKMDLDSLAHAEREARKSQTREMDPDRFAEFIREKTDTNIEISIDAIDRLYGEEKPSVEDGKLGMIPGVAEQLEGARASGGRVQVPLADWLAKVDPEVQKALHDDVAVRKGGTTKVEAEAYREQQALRGSEAIDAYHGSPAKFEAFDSQYMGSGEGAQAYAYGHYLAENQKVADEYKNVHRKKVGWTQPWLNPDELPEGNLYKVTIKREPHEFLDWETELSSQEAGKHILAKMDPEFKESLQEYLDLHNQPALEDLTGKQFHRLLERYASEGELPGIESRDEPHLRREASEYIKNLGIAGVKFLDQASRFRDNDAALIQRNRESAERIRQNIQRLEQEIANHGPDTATDFVAQRRRLIETFQRDAKLLDVRAAEMEKPQTRNYVVFNEADIEVTHRNNEAVNAVREAAGLKPLFGEIPQMEGGDWHSLGWDGHEAYMRPEELWTKNEERINAAVQEVLDRIAGKSVENIAADTIRRPGNKTTHALYTVYKDIKPIITWAFADPEVMGNIRHEVIHHLREYRFIKPEEWNILQRAALDGKWIEKYNINERYEGLSPFAKIEEAIAEAYKDWAERNVEAPAGAKPLFERIKALLDGVREKVKEILGFKPTYEQLFKKVESGEIAKRGPGKSRSGGMALKESRGPAQPELPGTRRMEDRKPFDRAPVGMSIDRAERYLKLIEKQHGEDLAKAEARAEKEQRKRQSTEWKAEAEAMRPEVTADVLNRPDVAVDRFLRDGILYDEQVDRVRIGAEYLTPEQQAALPKSYVAKKGMNPDDIAGLFGYDSGATMIERMAQYDRQWRESGVRREEFVRRQINQEINRRQELKHGRPLNESILEDAKEQAMSETQLSILHEQTYHFATEAGMEYPLKKEELQAIATKHFNDLPAEAVSSDRFLAESGRAGRAAEMAHLKGDAQEAFKQAQRQEYALHYAKLAQAEEKRQARFDKLAGRYSTRTLPAGVDRPYALHAASLLEQAGYPIRLRADEIRTELQAGEHSSLPELHSHSRDFGGGVYDMLTQDIMDNGVKPMEEMTVQERRDFRDAVQAIHEEGRAKELLDIRGEKIAFQEFRDMVRENFEKRGLIDPQTRSKMMEYWWSIDAKLITMENLLKDADFRQEMGPFFDAIIRTHEQSKSKAFQLEAELKESFDKLPGATFEWRQSLNKDLPNTLFVDPMAPTVPLKLRRENLLRIMLHQGTESNRYQLARGMMMAREGLKITEDRIEVGKQLIDQMIRTHATEQDAIFVKHIWDQHKKFRGEREQLQRNTSGNIVNWIEGRKVDFGFGEVDGEYYPLSPSRKYQLPGKEIAFETEPEHSKGPFQSVYTRATTPKNDLKQRTGKAYYVDITSPIENVAIELKHVIRDIAYRDFGIQAGKILYDPQIRNMFDRYYGPEYTKELIPWLKRALNIDNTHSRGGVYGAVEDFMRWARVNVTHSALGYNLATIGTPSIGTFKPRAYGAYMANHAEAVKITKDFSKVLNDMETLMERDVHKAVGDYIKKTRYSAFQEGAVQASFYAIKKVQLAMARVTFYEKFMEERPKQLKEALDKGLSPEEAMKVANDRASILADAKLRERHGSTGRGDMSPILADQNEFVKTFGTMFMGYFSTMYNWRRAIAHNAREMVGAEAPEARMKSRKEFMDAMIGTVAVPALFTGVFYTRAKKDENWLSFLSRVVLGETLGMYPVGREFTFWIDSGRFGSSPVHSMGDIGWNMIKDVRDTVQGKQPKKPFQHTMTALGSVGIVKGGMALGRQLGGIHNVFRRTEPPPRDFGEWMRLIRWGETKKPR